MRRNTPSVGRRYTFSAGKGVQYRSIISSVWMKVCSPGIPKLLKGSLVVVFMWKNYILQTIQL